MFKGEDKQARVGACWCFEFWKGIVLTHSFVDLRSSRLGGIDFCAGQPDCWDWFGGLMTLRPSFCWISGLKAFGFGFRSIKK